MGEYTDAVLTQALERAAVAVATQQSREDRFQQNQKCLKNKRRFADFNLFDFVACVD